MTRAARLVIDMRNCVIHGDWHGARSAAQALESLPNVGWAVATSALLADELHVVTLPACLLNSKSAPASMAP